LIEGQKWVKAIFHPSFIEEDRSSHIAIDNKLLYPLMKKVKRRTLLTTLHSTSTSTVGGTKRSSATANQPLQVRSPDVTGGVSVSIHFQATRTVEGEISSAVEDK
jgi:hypothetical protein